MSAVSHAQVVLDDESTPDRPRRVSLDLWIEPPSGLSEKDRDAAVRSAAIVLSERALIWLLISGRKDGIGGPGCQRRLKSDPLSILIAEVNLTHPGTLCYSGSAA